MSIFYLVVLCFFIIICDEQVVYILDQVRALEKEMLLRIEKQGLDVTPKILIVRILLLSFSWLRLLVPLRFRYQHSLC